MCLACNEGRQVIHSKPGKKAPWVTERNRSPEHIALITKHGYSMHPHYRTWQGMMKRCYDPNHVGYKNYGARGIVVYQPWHDVATYIQWIEQNLDSQPDPSYTIDRINNDGNYEPGNLRWASKREQARNQRAKVHLRGTALTQARLTEQIVRECRERWAKGELQYSLAAEFGVSNPTMHKALVGKTWQHVPSTTIDQPRSADPSSATSALGDLYVQPR